MAALVVARVDRSTGGPRLGGPGRARQRGRGSASSTGASPAGGSASWRRSRPWVPHWCRSRSGVVGGERPGPLTLVGPGRRRAGDLAGLLDAGSGPPPEPRRRRLVGAGSTGCSPGWASARCSRCSGQVPDRGRVLADRGRAAGLGAGPGAARHGAADDRGSRESRVTWWAVAAGPFSAVAQPAVPGLHPAGSAHRLERADRRSTPPRPCCWRWSFLRESVERRQGAGLLLCAVTVALVVAG